MKNISWINLLVGIWLLIAPFTMGAAPISGAPVANDVVLGVLLIATSWWILAATAPPTRTAWFQALCGLWLIASPFVLKYSGMRAPTGNDVVMGVVAIIVGVVESRALVTPPKPA
jgi:thiol:disulfide interchange protein